MIIKCHISYDKMTQKYFMEDFEHNLTKTKNYFVMQIYYLAEEIYYRLLEQETSEMCQPILVRLDFFSLVSGKIPSTWALNKLDKENAIFGPERWTKDFWEDYLNGNQEAIKRYKDELELIRSTDKDFI
jgi:hypothetical protein